MNDAPGTARGWRRIVEKDLVGFCVVALLLLAYLFRDAWLRGYVLGQTDILFDTLPWQPHRPPGIRVHNRLLGDIPTIFYPFLWKAREMLRSGILPLWVSGVGAGHPFFASFQTALLSPFTIIDMSLSFPSAFVLDVAARLFVGGLGMYLFLRRLPLCALAALFGAVGYLLNPFSLVWLEHPLSAVAAWLPWVLLAVDTCASKPGLRSTITLAAATALIVLAGHPETAFKAMLLAGGYALYRGVASGAPIKTLAAAGAGVALGLALSAIQLVPFLEYVRESRTLAIRATAEAPLFTSPPAAFATAFVPDFFGNPSRGRFVLDGTNYCEMQAYPGIVTWVFAGLALLHRRHRGRVLFFLAAAAAGFLVMYGTPLARAVTFLIPPLRVAALSRFGLLAVTGLIIAGAIGVDAALGGDRDAQVARSPRFTLIAAVVVGVVAATIAGFLLAQHALLIESRQWARTLTATRTAAELLGGAGVVVWLLRAVRWRVLTVAPVALLAVDLLMFSDGFHAFVPKAYAFPAIDEFTLLRSEDGPFRVAGWRNALPPNTSLVYGLQDFRVYDGIGVKHYSELLDLGFSFNGSSHELGQLATPHLLDLLNITFVLTPQDVDLPADRFDLVRDGPMRVYRNRLALPRAFLADEAVVLSGDLARRALRNREIDVRHVVTLASALDPTVAPEPALTDLGRAVVTQYGDTDVSVATRASGRRLLVLTDVYYPGWKATIDGVPAPILRADHAFRAVSVPAGEHVVEFRYRPTSVTIGATISLAALIGMIVGWRRRLDPPKPA